MIQLIVNTVMLDLPPGLQLERELETAIFRRNGEATDFVYPVDLPLTEKNTVALWHPDILSKTFHHDHHACALIVDGIYTRGVLYIENVNLANKTVRVSISGDYGGFWLEAQNVRLNELELGGVRTVGTINTGAIASEFIDPTTTKCELFYTPCTTGTHIEAVMNGSTVTDYLFYMAIDQKMNLINEKIHAKQNYQDESADGIIPEPRSIINHYFYNNSGDKGVIDPVKAYIETTFQSTTLVTHDRYFWVPFFRLAFVIKKCFEDLGWTVYGDILTDANFLLVTLYNTYAINRCNKTETDTGTNTYEIRIEHNATEIDPKNHVPKMSVPDFLREVGKNFNLQYIPNYATREMQVNIVGDFAPVPGNIVDITAKVNPLPEISYQEFNATKGYQLEFENDENDGAIFEHIVNSVDDVTVYTTYYDVYTDLAGVASPTDLDVAYVKADNAFYQYHAGDGLWHFYGYNFTKYETSLAEGLVQIKTKAVPVPVSRINTVCRMSSPNKAFLQSPHTVTYEHGLQLPYSKMGIEGKELLSIQRYPLAGIGGDAKDAYQNAFGIVTASIPATNPHLCNYLGLSYISATAGAASHPCGNSDIHDAQGTLRQGLRLYWNNRDGEGLYNDFWKNYVESLLGSVVAEYEMLWETDAYRDINLQTSFLQISSLLFLCDKANIVFPFPSKGKIKLVRYG